jgi:hypothetical protein
MSSWVPAIGAAIAAIGGFIVAFYQAQQKRQADKKLSESDRDRARLVAELDEARDQANAQRAYEFEARKRLYKELQPLLFQLKEQSENARWRIGGLAESAREGRLYPRKRNRLREDSPSYLPSTLYRFMAPLVSYRLCQRKLTTVDLSLDEQLDMKYRLAKMLYRTWSDGGEIADCQPLPNYAADRKKSNISLQKIERIIEAMTFEDGSGDSIRCLTLGEFLGRYEDPGSLLCSAIEPLKEIFIDFSPESRPVLWRMLIVHAHLYAALSSPGQVKVPPHPLNVLPREEWAKFDWRKPGDERSDQETVEDTFAAARTYLADQALVPRISSEPTSNTKVGVPSDNQSVDSRQDPRP